MRFEQVSISNHVKFFKKGFLERWKLSEQIDKTKPLVIFGFNGNREVYESHESYKILILSTPTDFPDFNHLNNNEKTIIVADKKKYSDKYIPESVIFKHETIEIKDYSMFTPNVLGDKIYYYSGFKNGWGGRWGEEKIKEMLDRDWETLGVNIE